MIIVGDSLTELKSLEAESVHCCVTSPPYWGLRDYGVDGQLGLEKSPEEYVSKLLDVFREVRRVLRKDGTLWLNLGDSYSSAGHKDKYWAGLKPKDLVGIPWRVAFALQADGWYLRSDIIWHKPNPMPESIKDRPTKAHEYIFLLSKAKKYQFDMDAIREPHTAKGRPPGNKSRIYFDRDPSHHNGQKRRPGKEKSFHELGRSKRSVWLVSPKPFKGAHFATFPPDLIEPCILAGCPKGGTVLDPFFGAGTTGVVAEKHGRDWIGIELNPEYAAMASERIRGTQKVLG